MAKLDDQDLLRKEQYRNSTNLDARASLHARFSVNQYGWHRWIWDQFQFPARARLLELGCGPAYLWQENGSRIPVGWRVTLTDFSPGMVEKARENTAQLGHPFAFGVMDAQHLPFDDSSFDGVIANHMLYHVPDRDQALSEIRRVLCPGGRFYASTIGRTHMQDTYDLIDAFDPSLNAQAMAPNISFTLENGREQMAGFFEQVERTRYEDNLVIPKAGPLVDYLVSSLARAPMISGRLDDLERFLTDRIRATGPLSIRKDSGLFTAIRRIEH